MNILLIDNRDSFVYNVKALIEQCNVADRVDVVPNDKIDFGRLGYYSGIVLSPGPGIPNEAADMPKSRCRQSADNKRPYTVHPHKHRFRDYR